VRFSACPDRPWGPPSLPYNAYRVFPGGKVRPGRAADHSPLLVPWSWKSRAIPLPTLCAISGPVTGTVLAGYVSNKLVVLYGCEAWSLRAREERKLRVFENMVLRRIFGPRRDEVTGEWR